MEKSVSYTKFAKIYGVSQAMVSKYVLSGSITNRSLVKKGNRRRIIPSLAIKDLEKNLDPSQRKKRCRKNSTITQELIDEIEFQLTDENVAEKMTFALNTIAFVAEHFIPEYKNRLMCALDVIASVFGVRFVGVEGLIGQRVITAVAYDRWISRNLRKEEGSNDE